MRSQWRPETGSKPYRVVLVAVMRKLLVHLNAVVAAQDRAEPLPLEKTGQNQLA